MANFEPEKYKPTIDAILSVADLEEITVNKIRNALQELFSIDLKPYKKEIKTVILERFDVMFQKRKDDNERERLKEIERKDAILAAQLSRAEKRTMRGKPKKPKRAAPTTGGLAAEVMVSNQLAEVLGASKLPRKEITKNLWVYIKSHNLQDPEDGRVILCDDKLEQLFKKKKVGMFEMNKIINAHIFKPSEVSYSSAEPTPPNVETTSSPALQSPTSDDFNLSDSVEPPTKRMKSENGQAVAVANDDSSESEAE